MLNSVLAEEKRRFLVDEKKAYLESIKIKPEEREKVCSWVNKGNSVYNNPWLLYSESGHPLDYVTAMRTVADMEENPETHKSIHSTAEDGSFTEVPF